MKDSIEPVGDDAIKPQEKATLYTREQLIQMGRISEDEQKEQNTTEIDADLSKLTEVQQKTQQRVTLIYQS